jgi:hypothetical protein
MKPAAQRDDGLHRVSSLTRWLTAGAVVVGGVFTAAVARAVPGHAKSTPLVTSPGSDEGGFSPFGDEGGTGTATTPATTPPTPALSPSTQSPSAGSSQGTLTPPRQRLGGRGGRGSVSSGSS